MTEPHIIQKQFVEVIANGIGDSFALQKDVEAVCKLMVNPGLEALLDKYGNTNEVIRIDKLFIEVGNVSSTEFESMLAEKVLHKIDDALRERVHTGAIKTDQGGSTIFERDIELLVFYLQKGYLPWWSTVKSAAEWRQKLDYLLSAENGNTEWSILRKAFNEELVRDRLLAEFTDQQFWTITARISKVDRTILQADLTSLRQQITKGNSHSAFDKTYKALILKSIAHALNLPSAYKLIAEHTVQKLKDEPQLLKISPDLGKEIRNKELQILLNQLSTDQQTVTKSSKPSETKKPLRFEPDIINKKLSTLSKDDVLRDEIYIGDSGLTIIAPYLPLFFKNLQLVNKDQISDVPKALALLHYLTYGDNEYAEFECVLAKVLCGVDLNAVIERSQIAEQEKVLSNELLQAVIDHWQILKNTSLAALQTSFLQREGRLTFGNNEWNLKVHNESYDLLLSHLPWNIHIIKLPWMDHILKIDWV